MNIKYKDITLRAIEDSDLELILEMINDPEIEKMTGGGGFPVSMFQQKKWYETIQNKNDELRLMIDTENHGTIGLAMLTGIDYKNGTAEFHAKIATSRNIRGNGYGTKAYKAIFDYAFNQMNLNCIYTGNIEYNTVTEQIKEKCGFQKEGILRERVYKNGKYHNIAVWSLLRDDWKELNQNEY
jgi:RimJ/RimL family protein N-acetyltransferase